MAIKTEFEAWVNEAKTFDWGIVLKTSHQQRAKNPTSGEWETVGKDYIDVVVTAEQFNQIQNAQIVRVVGTNLKVSTFAKKDGTTGVSLKTNAAEIYPVERGGSQSSAPVVDEEMPF